MSITLKDVARHAGVSPKTVSRVVNNQGEISQETRARVQAAILELGYRPNILARSLVNQRTNTIGVVASGIELFGPSRTILGIELQAEEFGYSLSLNLLRHAEDPNVNLVLDELIARRVDGIIWAVPEVSDNHSWFRENGAVQLPPIVLLTTPSHPDFSSVAVDNCHGAKIAVNHLLEQGRCKVGIITGPLNSWEARERLAGWREALSEANIEAAAAAIVEGDWSAASGQRGMETLLQNAPDLDALFCCNDQMALGALGVLHHAGKRVPQDIALVGYDNIPEAEFFIPPLTTIYQQLTEIGRAAVQELHAQIDARRREESRATSAVMMTPCLIVRASSRVT